MQQDNGSAVAAGPTAPESWGALSRLPGHPLMWVLIASELAVFGAALIGYAGARFRDPAGFAVAQDHLDRVAGVVNTAVLITSGLFAALAVEARKTERRVAARWRCGAAIALGGMFVAVKFGEYAKEIAAGFTLDSGGFFTLYYLITGFHALHVLLGMAILGIVARHDSLANYETGAAFWHMVDLIWIVVFPCIYLLR